ncbi:TIM barrel protein [Streptomyces lonarensis]|uniref:TIM barrel protein n=1 Tax=Streptomyces lonarensis TaxID=700599 RepID=UPI0028ADEA28|nr:TIM barrel protein [Streptomyces lonarensis]
MSVTIRVANAPVNFGIYQPDSAPFTAPELLAALADAGYAGVDSGPIGYLGTGDTLRARLAETGLHLAGGWVDLRFTDEDGWREDLAGLDAALDVFTAAEVDDPRFAPRPTLSLPADPVRFARPGLALGGIEDWPGFARRLQETADRCRERGLEAVYHHHLGTLVESEAEVDRVLDSTDVSLCLDTGHLYLAGGEPTAALRRWAPRVKQVHVKDGSRALTERSREAGLDFDQLVAEGGFTVLGEGDLAPADTVAVLREIGYTGWVVVEQDAPATGRAPASLLADQRTNREVLRKADL